MKGLSSGGRTHLDQLRPTPARCPFCALARGLDHDPLIKHGAITVALDPVEIRWRGHYVPLSCSEAGLFGHIALKGRASFAEIDRALKEMGVDRNHRGACLTRIRQKFRRLGAADPFEVIGSGLRIRREPDQQGCKKTVIGLDASIALPAARPWLRPY